MNITARTAAYMLCACTLPAAAATTVTGEAEVLVRDRHLSGDHGKYRQHVDLGSGVRLGAAWLEIRPDNPAAPDLLRIAAQGLGGDPWEHLSLEVRKYGSYRVTYARTQSEFFYHDRLIAAADVRPSASDDGDLHTFDFRRTRHRAAFEWQATQRDTLEFTWDAYEKRGNSTTVLDISREEFEMARPLDQRQDRFGLAWQHRFDNSVLRVSHRRGEHEDDRLTLLTEPSLGSSPAAPTRLQSYRLDAPTSTDADESTITWTWRPNQQWRTHVSALQVDADLDFHAGEGIDGIGFDGAPLRPATPARGAADRTVRRIDAGAEWTLSDRWRLALDGRTQRLEQDADFNEGSTDSRWRVDEERIGVRAEADLTDTLTTSLGWRWRTRRFDHRLTDAITLLDESQDSRSGTWFAELRYRPSLHWLVHMSVEDDDLDDAFVTSLPTDARRWRLRARYRWTAGTTAEASWSLRDLENRASGWEGRVGQLHGSIHYPGERLELLLSASRFTYDTSILQNLRAGTRQVLFDIDEEVWSSIYHASGRYRIDARWSLQAQHDRSSTKGHVEARRLDWRVGVGLSINAHAGLEARYRRVTHDEDFEAFRAHIVELALRLNLH